jgi:hypothetical protein
VQDCILMIADVISGRKKEDENKRIEMRECEMAGLITQTTNTRLKKKEESEDENVIRELRETHQENEEMKRDDELPSDLGLTESNFERILIAEPTEINLVVHEFIVSLVETMCILFHINFSQSQNV